MNKLSLSNQNEDRYITPLEFARRMGVCRNWVYQMKKRGELPIRKIGAGRYRIDWLAWQEQENGKPQEIDMRRKLRVI